MDKELIVAVRQKAVHNPVSWFMHTCLVFKLANRNSL